MKTVTVSDAITASGLTFTASQRKSIGVIALLTARKRKIAPIKTMELIDDVPVKVNGYPDTFLPAMVTICEKFSKNPIFRKKKKGNPKRPFAGKGSKHKSFRTNMK
jgi:hypothetical protein